MSACTSAGRPIERSGLPAGVSRRRAGEEPPAAVTESDAQAGSLLEDAARNERGRGDADLGRHAEAAHRGGRHALGEGRRQGVDEDREAEGLCLLEEAEEALVAAPEGAGG